MSTTNLREMFRDTAIKAHIGFKHEGRWEECQWIECEDRRRMIMNSNLAGADEQIVGDEERATVSKPWSDEFPEVEETFYWIRHKQNHADLNVGLLRDGTLLLAEGTTHGKSRRRDFEYLPASPSDFEQLIRLRQIAQHFVTAYSGKEHQLGNGQALRSFLSFREALAPTAEKSNA